MISQIFCSSSSWTSSCSDKEKSSSEPIEFDWFVFSVSATGVEYYCYRLWRANGLHSLPNFDSVYDVGEEPLGESKEIKSSRGSGCIRWCDRKFKFAGFSVLLCNISPLSSVFLELLFYLAGSIAEPYWGSLITLPPKPLSSSSSWDYWSSSSSCSSIISLSCIPTLS